MNSRKVLIRFLLLGVLLLGGCRSAAPYGTDFDGERAYQDVLTQMSFGARHPGSEGHARTQEWLTAELGELGWHVEQQMVDYGGVQLSNVIAYSQEIPGDPWIILGAHYDTRPLSDQESDPALAQQPVPGANDGASGVAVLLELARVLQPDVREHVWLVFFDYEDSGGIDGLDWTLGSRTFVEQLGAHPNAAVIVDMIGDADLDIYYELASDDTLSEEIWAVAAQEGVAQFIAVPRHHMLDDHTAFLLAGIPAVDIIDFDYPYWHTTADTADKVSAQSLDAVGTVLLAWLRQSVP